MKLLGFQKWFLQAATSGDYDTLGFSYPRGSGKSFLSGHLVSRIMNPADPLFRPGTESVLLSGSIEQCRIVYRFAREILEPMGGYRWVDSATRVAITHPETHTRLRVVGSNARTTFGLVQCPWVIWDEPGAAETNSGELLYDAVMTSQGKPGSPLTVLCAGTLAPALSGWWHDLVKAGTHDNVYVQAVFGDPEKWDDWREIQRCNPLARIDAKFRKKLLAERDEARRDTRLNAPTADDSSVLLTVPDWKRVCAREPGATEGRPIAAVDLGGGRAWSAACIGWRSGRVEAVAVAPGTPSLEFQEKRDRVPAGTYTRLAEAGVLTTDGTRRVPRVEALLDLIRPWRPERIIADRFRLPELQDVYRGLPVVPRVTRWSESAEDIRALCKMALDGPLTVGPDSRALIGELVSCPGAERDVRQLPAHQGDIKKLNGAVALVQSQDSMGSADRGRADWQGRRLGFDAPSSLVDVASQATREVLAACGVSPALFDASAAAAAREAWRQLLFGTIAPLGRLVSDELSRKLETTYP